MSDATNPAVPAAPVVPATPAVPAAPAPVDPPAPAPVDPPAPAPVDPAADPAGDPPPPAPLSWAELREKHAGGDEKISKRLARYSSTEAALDALIAAQDRIASGGLKAALPKDATPEQINAWRVENGVPETPDAYDISVPADLELTDEGRDIIDGFLATAHEANLTSPQAEAALNYLFERQAAQAEARAEADAESRMSGEEALRAEWGHEYRLNVNLVNNMLDGAPEGLKDDLLSARLPDGTPAFHDPRVLRWMANMAREINPAATVVPAGQGLEGVVSKLAEIEGLMADRDSKYWKGPEAKSLQEEYLKLVTARDNLKKRG